eukprot:TRINITY_DN105039_c0_g1_i1.p1 TRINITY_DN105039_c0_g1~~TRINITY_DN105039_c0_g1_i1.p1  ORF type:complete len:650 (-),score=94.37 TRINITY_DN105039_c0_g1_i1:151-2055(-)
MSSDRRLPFSGWRCIWDPQDASDSDKYQPYAQLTVTILRGKDLLAQDNALSGMSSDPYVTISLDGAKNLCRSKTINANLNPVWNETHTLEIKHPSSVMVVKVLDEDMGTNLGQLDFFGSDDDFMGLTEVDLARLPLNEDIEGCFPLTHPDDVKTLFAHKKQPEKRLPKRAGAIYLRLRMDVKHPHDEFCALCLPAPKQPHEGMKSRYGGFDVGDLFIDIVALGKEALLWATAIRNIMADLSSHITAFTGWLICLLLIWFPHLILPVLVTIVGVAVAYSEFYLGELMDAHEIDSSGYNPTLQEELGTPHPSILRDFGYSLMRRLKGMKMAILRMDRWFRDKIRCEKTTPLLPKNPRSRANRAAEEDEKMVRLEAAKKDQEAVHQFAKKISTVSGLLSEDVIEQLEEFEEFVLLIKYIIELLEVLVQSPVARLLIRLNFMGVVLLLLWFKYYQALVAQLALTLFITSQFIPHTVLGRIALCTYLYCDGKYREKAFWALDPNIDVQSDPRNGQLRRIDTKSLIYAGLNRDPTLEFTQIPHQMEIETFTSLTHCDECHMLLLGIIRQGYRCQLCKRVTCAACKERLNDDCQPNPERPPRANRGAIAGPFSCCQTPDIRKGSFSFTEEADADLEAGATL